MKIFLLIIILALLSWKGYHAWRRGRNVYVKEILDCLSRLILTVNTGVCQLVQLSGRMQIGSRDGHFQVSSVCRIWQRFSMCLSIIF